jgi:two-component system CheB/CheR fusion protein
MRLKVDYDRADDGSVAVRLSGEVDLLDAANEFLETVLTSLRAGVAVLDRQLQVRAWNKPAEELWGVRRDEALGQHFLNLDIGLPTDQLRPALRSVFAAAASRSR